MYDACCIEIYQFLLGITIIYRYLQLFNAKIGIPDFKVGYGIVICHYTNGLEDLTSVYQFILVDTFKISLPKDSQMQLVQCMLHTKHFYHKVEKLQ